MTELSMSNPLGYFEPEPVLPHLQCPTCNNARYRITPGMFYEELIISCDCPERKMEGEKDDVAKLWEEANERIRKEGVPRPLRLEEAKAQLRKRKDSPRWRSAKFDWRKSR